jgi:hypothetical protein
LPLGEILAEHEAEFHLIIEELNFRRSNTLLSDLIGSRRLVPASIA